MLDILRGCAILGMVIVHFWQGNPNEGGGALGAAINQGIGWFIAGKAATTFAILFGVGFAIQLQRADARGENGRWRFLRRLLGVALFGVLVAALAGVDTLIMYAVSGVASVRSALVDAPPAYRCDRDRNALGDLECGRRELSMQDPMSPEERTWRPHRKRP
ncbi:MAG: heparan-alpha-glucosaminide N-acetyltransferase domain-containing protein [Acidobacteria bacterium]|nr:heparan-alpha-glucosaminide N-acetyltransferase domain-containing protein [Acidobacteriota bacterium]